VEGGNRSHWFPLHLDAKDGSRRLHGGDPNCTRAVAPELHCGPRHLLAYRIKEARSDTTMNIGCLGWGSLVWNPDTLPVQGRWYHDGPLLPVEFARHSSRDRVTLVLVPTVPLVRTLWCSLAVTDLETARNELAARESVTQTKDRSIGFWPRTSGAGGMSADVIVATTPGAASARAKSMWRIRACAWGLRTSAASSVPVTVGTSSR
jgi:hypothetical protein